MNREFQKDSLLSIKSNIFTYTCFVSWTDLFYSFQNVFIVDLLPIVQLYVLLASFGDSIISVTVFTAIDRQLTDICTLTLHSSDTRISATQNLPNVSYCSNDSCIAGLFYSSSQWLLQKLYELLHYTMMLCRQRIEKLHCWKSALNRKLTNRERPNKYYR